jgi:hypothetical protein
VKPAQDEKGLVMIPLEKQSSKTAKDGSANCQVELVYLIKGAKLGKRGNIAISIPVCDIPINQLFVEVYLPDGFKYGEFTGMRERSWSQNPS